MPDYQKMYLRLFNGLTDALEEFERANYGRAAEILRQAQIASEEMYLEDDSDDGEEAE